jgi:branched-subunit amino acid aminotransferase/4-amino-4-deoxychorismate lyase
VGTFGLIYYGRLAERNGFDDALLISPDGTVSEGAVANIAFFDGTGVVWPDAPALHGITMQLHEQRLADSGLPSRHGTVRLGDLTSFDAAFLTNAIGIAAVRQIDDLSLPVNVDLMTTVTQVTSPSPGPGLSTQRDHIVDQVVARAASPRSNAG